MTTTLDSDRALEREADDQFGFVSIAKRLAPSIVEASKGDGMVIGLEGRWGSGKTSLLNLLRAELYASQCEGVHTIEIAPWLNGDASSMVTSLIEPMAAILRDRESEASATSDEQAKIVKENIAEVGKLLREYGPKTARRISLVANVAGYLIPGAQAIGGALESGADALEKIIPSGPTPSELKKQIVDKIKHLNISFVVFLDDLDRLEPKQAVEVVRLVRSVADFPRVIYLMCYDREVLCEALKAGLGVTDGDLFLQKIVQLTFNMPLPEPFDLRLQFFDESKVIYSEVMGRDADEALLDDLSSAVSREGVGLSTPREVKIALNSIRFVFPQVHDDVYFPDLCRLHLIKTTNYKLYHWLETYLSLRSVIATGDAVVSTDDKIRLGRQLAEILPLESSTVGYSVWDLHNFVPGVVSMKEDQERVFNAMNSEESSSAVALKRIGSPLHYRFYFALTGPKTVMPDHVFNRLLELACMDVDRLAERLTEEVKKRRISGKTWFEHVLDRIDGDCISTLNEGQLTGIALALSKMMDTAMAQDTTRRLFSPSLDGIASMVVGNCLRRLGELSTEKQTKVVLSMATEGAALNWMVGKFFRSQLLKHRRLGNEPVSHDQLFFGEDALHRAIIALKDRITEESTLKLIPKMPDVKSYLYGWMDIAGDNQVIDWVRTYISSDDAFLNMLEHLRGWSMSDRVYYPLPEENVTMFLDWDETVKRLDSLRSGKHADQVAELQLAIQQSLL